VSGRYQLDAWADTTDEAHRLGFLVKDRLDGYRGPMGADETLVAVQGIFAEDARATYDSAADLHRVSRDYFIFHEER
jgi:uncharacterized protein YdbL (DUF1318 family)